MLVSVIAALLFLSAAIVFVLEYAKAPHSAIALGLALISTGLFVIQLFGTGWVH